MRAVLSYAGRNRRFSAPAVAERDGALDDAGPSGQPRVLSAAPRRLTVWRSRRRCLGPLDRRLARLYAGCRTSKPARPQAARGRPAAGLTSALAARVISRFGVGDRAQPTGATRRSQRPWRRTGYGQGSQARFGSPCLGEGWPIRASRGERPQKLARVCRATARMVPALQGRRDRRGRLGPRLPLPAGTVFLVGANDPHRPGRSRD